MCNLCAAGNACCQLSHHPSNNNPLKCYIDHIWSCILSLTCTGTGHEVFAQSVQATTRFKATAIPAKKSYYRTDESPDVWFEPTEVWEIRGADLTISPVHKAAVGHIHPDRGISLRYLLNTLPEYTHHRQSKGRYPPSPWGHFKINVDRQAMVFSFLMDYTQQQQQALSPIGTVLMC